MDVHFPYYRVYDRFVHMLDSIYLPIYHKMAYGLKSISENVLFIDLVSCLTLVETKLKTVSTENLIFTNSVDLSSLVEAREMSLLK